jgi:hypothetical protein
MTGAPNPLPGGGYCEICKKWDHHPTKCPLLHKYHSIPRNLFFNFFKSPGHEEKDFHVFNLMRDITSYMYMIQEENVAAEWVVHNIIIKEVSIKGTKETLAEARGRGNFGRGGRGLIICYNYNQLGHLDHVTVQNPCTMCTYYRALDHRHKIVPN